MFQQDNIFLDLAVTTKEEVFSFIAQQSIALGLAQDEEGVKNGLYTREVQFTTNTGEGIALPHTKHNAVKKPAVLVLKFTNPVIWAEDEEPVTVAISILVPEKNEGNVHLKLLSCLARKLVHDDFKEALLNATTKEEVKTLIDDAFQI